MNLRWIIPISLFGGLLNRWRGGWGSWPPSHQARRITLAALTGVLATGLFGLSLWSAAFVVLLFVGFLPGWGKWFQVRNAKELAFMSLRGLFLTGLPSVVLWFWVGPDVALFWGIGGLTMGPLYAAGYKLPKQLGQTEWGETLFGAWLWFSLMAGYGLS